MSAYRDAFRGIPKGVVYQKSVVTLTRPADLPGAYAAGDSVSDSTSSPTDLEFTFDVPGGNAIDIMKVTLTRSGTSDSSLQLFLFDQTVTATNDHTAFALTDSDANKHVSTIHLFKQSPATNNIVYDTGAIQERVELASADTKLYGLLKTVDGFTPESAETFQFTIWADIK